jgi:hypothetical protein
MFKNPMMLMMAGTAVMMFAMPWLMSNMDPEAVEDAKKMQAKIFGAQQAIQSGDLATCVQACELPWCISSLTLRATVLLRKSLGMMLQCRNLEVHSH